MSTTPDNPPSIELEDRYRATMGRIADALHIPIESLTQTEDEYGFPDDAAELMWLCLNIRSPETRQRFIEMMRQAIGQ